MNHTGNEKTCRVCGRRMTWRKKWADSWDTVKFCSGACRKRGLKPLDSNLERAIVDLLSRRAGTATICPSEAARSVSSDPEQWQKLMEPTRMAARRLVACGQVVIVQRGQVVEPSTARGAIRIRRGASFTSTVEGAAHGD